MGGQQYAYFEQLPEDINEKSKMVVFDAESAGARYGPVVALRVTVSDQNTNMLSSLVAASRQSNAAIARLCSRGLSASAISATDALQTKDSAFLRFGNPVPSDVGMSQHLPALPETKVTRLSNGMRVVSEQVPGAATSTVGVWIDAGSRYETDSTNGTAHFLEHMAFKGTQKRSVKDLEVEIEDIGGHLNAYTSREQTCYFAKVQNGHVGQAVDILSDILQNSKLEEHAIERERDVILREMQEIEGMPEEVVFDHLHATAFQHSPLGRTILGPADNVRAITKQNLVDYISTNYTADRMVVAASGGVDHATLVKAAEQHFSKLPEKGVSTADLVRSEPAFFTGSEVRMRDPDQPLVHLAIAFEGASWTDPDSIPLMVMQTMLGTWDKNASSGRHGGSKLAELIATNNLADSMMAFNTNYHDTGLFGVYATADPKTSNLEDLCWGIMRHTAGMCYNVSDSDVSRAKNQLKASILYSQDGTTGTAEELGRSMLVYGRRIPRAELFARIDAVDAATIKAIANKFIFDQDIAVATLGNTQFMPDYTWLRRRTYMLRY